MIGIFFISTSWGRLNGGINSINYSLIRNFTKIVDLEEWKVYCILTENKVDSDIISDVEEKYKLELICTKNPISSKKINQIIEKNNFKQIFFIGHDVITGKFSNELRDKYTNSTSIIFHHMFYKNYYYSREFNPKKIREKENLQKEIIPNADIVVAIGPLLFRSANDLCIDARKEPKIYEIIPGLENIEPIKRIHNNHTILLFGRLEERNNCVKQIDLAITAIAEYLKDSNKDYTIKCYGYADDSEENQRKILEDAFFKAGKSVNIRANSYIKDEKILRDEIASASLCIMPSFFEGFGLTGYEAISAGVPVIISRNTGLYEFLINKQGERIENLFKSLQIQGNPTDLEEAYTNIDKENLKECIDAIFRDYKLSKENALELRKKLIDSHYTWEYAARNFKSIINNEIKYNYNIVPKGELITKKCRMNFSKYISESMLYRYCNIFCNAEKIVLKIVKYSNNRNRRFTIFSSDEQEGIKKQDIKKRLINDGTVGILNDVYNSDKSIYPIVVSDFTNSRCYCVTEDDINEIKDLNLGIPDHHVLSIVAVPIIHNGIEGAITLDIFDEQFIKNIMYNKEVILRTLYRYLKLLAEDLINKFYYEIYDDINFSEVNNMVRNREIISFKGRCPLECKHCFAREIVNDSEEDEDVEDIINYLKSKSFDVVYVSHYKENFFNAMKGVRLCYEIYNNFKCDICVTTRCILVGRALSEISKLNKIMQLNGNRLTFCISVPAYESYDKFENKDIIPTPQQRIDFAGQIKNLNITSIVTIRPMFPSNIVSLDEITEIVDKCVGKVDAILTGGLYVSNDILKRLNINDSDLCYVNDIDSEYLKGIEKNFKAVDVTKEIAVLEDYCIEKNIPFFMHSMEALNYFKGIV